MNALRRNPFMNRVYSAGLRVFVGITGAVHWVFERTRTAWRTLRAVPWSVLRARLLLALAIVAISVFWGMATAVLEKNAVYLLIGLILSVFILIDFRVGAVTLIIMMPISGSTIFPHELLGIKGLNPINLVLLATLFAYGIRRIFIRSNYKFFPRDLIWFYVLPITIAAVIGVQHYGEIPSFMLVGAGFDDAKGFVRDTFIRPMFLVLFALIVGAAVAETQRAEVYLLAGLVSVWIMILTTVGYVLASGLSIGDISGSDERGFFSPLGFHANSLGRLLAVGFSLALFSTRIANRGKFAQVMIWFTVGMAALATMLTFSRGSFLVVLVIGILYVLTLKREQKRMALVVGLPLLLLAMPGAVYNRLFFGFDNGFDLNTISSDRTDDIWAPLIPEIFHSPIIGHGLSSILWSDALKSGAISPVSHPHNAFLKALLDTGFLGTTLTLWFAWQLWKRMRDLSRDHLLDSGLRGFFAGGAAAMVGFGVGGISGSSIDPIIEQVFLWFAIGIMYGISSSRQSQEKLYG